MLKNHPKGLKVLFFTEMWERFGFYIMMAVFVLYMDKQFGWDDSKKGDYYGIFLGAVYFIPILGGWIGDKIMGRLNTIRLGAGILIFGYSALASSSLDSLYFFYIGLVLISFGTGIFKANVSVIVGGLYREKPELRDAGFNIFYMGINIGSAASALVATILSSLYGNYNISFWAAAFGMLLSLIIFEIGHKQIGEVDNNKDTANNEDKSNGTMSHKEEWQRIASLVTLFIIVIFFWIAFYQNGFALTLFAERSTIKSDILRPETYQFFNPFFIVVLTPLVLAIFKRLNSRGKEPSTPKKMFLGMFIMSASMFIMVIASILGGNFDQNIMSPSWLIGTYVFVTLAEILISPMGLSFVSKVAPSRVQGLMMGCWFGATAMGSYGSGLIGKFYSEFSHHIYFILLSVLLLISALLVWIFMKRLEKFSA
jgi:POT family proton-dependent oligopeptide transporter